MPFEPLLRFVVVFEQVLRERVEVQPVVDKRVVRVVDRQVAVQVAVHIAREPPWVEPLSSRREPH